jgi:hypothetical protein
MNMNTTQDDNGPLVETQKFFRLMVIFPFAGGTAIGGFAVLRFMSAEYGLATFDLTVAATFYALGVYTYVTGRDKASRYIASAVSLVGPLFVLQQFSLTGMFWVYSSTIVLYYMIPLRQAIAGNVLLLLGVVYISSGIDYDQIQFYAFLITIGLTNMFSLFFSELTERSIRDRIQLEQAQREVEALREALPICANCHQIRDESNTWHQLESYFSDNRATRFSHGICPDCSEELYGTKLAK